MGGSIDPPSPQVENPTTPAKGDCGRDLDARPQGEAGGGGGGTPQQGRGDGTPQAVLLHLPLGDGRGLVPEPELRAVVLGPQGQHRVGLRDPVPLLHAGDLGQGDPVAVPVLVHGPGDGLGRVDHQGLEEPGGGRVGRALAPPAPGVPALPEVLPQQHRQPGHEGGGHGRALLQDEVAVAGAGVAVAARGPDPLPRRHDVGLDAEVRRGAPRREGRDVVLVLVPAVGGRVREAAQCKEAASRGTGRSEISLTWGT